MFCAFDQFGNELPGIEDLAVIENAFFRFYVCFDKQIKLLVVFYQFSFNFIKALANNITS